MPHATTAPAKPDRSRNVFVFGATSFLNDTASEMAYWVLPAFLASLGAGPAALGLIEGIAESVASLGKLGSGYLSDHVGRRKPLVVAGYTVANAVKPVLAIATAWWHVLFIRFADRLAKGMRGAPRDVMLAESVQKHSVGSAFGLLQSMDSAGAVAGPLIAVWIVAHYGVRGVFWAAAIPGFLAIVLVSALARETGEKTPAARKEHQTQSPVKLSGSFFYVLFVVSLFSLGNSSDMFLVLRAQSIGITVAQAPLLGLVFNVTYTLFSWPAGKLSDHLLQNGKSGRLGSRQAMAAGGYLVFAIVYAVFAWAPSRAAIWAMMACYGVYYALTTPVLKAMVAETAPSAGRGRAFGIFYFASSVAALAASILTGQLWKHFGPQLPFYLSAGLAALAAVLLVGKGRIGGGVPEDGKQ